MNGFVNFCAGASKSNLPGEGVNALLINIFSYCKTPRAIETTIKLIKDSQAKHVMQDSGGYQLKLTEKENKEILMDEETLRMDPLASFRLTDESLENLESEGLPDDIITQLKKIMYDVFRGKREFLEALKKVIGKEQTKRYKEMILEHVEVREVINLTPKHNVDIATEIRPHNLVGLDFPIKDLKDLKKSNVQPDVEFLNKLGFNLVWAVETARQVKEAKLKNKLSQELKLFLPIQCYSLEQFEWILYFLREENIDKFDGFSIPLRNVSLKETAKLVIRFYQLGIRRLHFLGVGNFKHIAFAAFLPKLLPELEWLSVDATSWYGHGKKMRYIDHNNFSVKHIDDINKIYCPCPYCQKRPHIVNVEKIQGITDKEINHELRSFISGHNFWVTEQLGNEISQSQSINSIARLKRHLIKRSSGVKDINKRVKAITEICDALYLTKEYKDADIKYLAKVA